MRLDKDVTQESIFTSYKHSLSVAQSVICLMNAAIGAGVLKLGYGYRCGILLAPILTALIGLMNYISYWFLSWSIYHTKGNSFAEIWIEAIGSKTVVFPILVTCLGSLAYTMYYIQFIIDSIFSLLENLGLEQDLIKFKIRLIINPVSIMCIVYLFLVLPLIFKDSLRFLYKISIVSLGLCIILFFNTFFWFIKTTLQKGFNPKKQLKFASFDSTAISCINSLLTAFTTYPNVWPGPRHYSLLSIEKLKKIFAWQSVLCWLLYTIFGTVSYLTLFDENEGGLILKYYPKGAMRFFAEASLVFMMAFTLPMTLNSCRYSILEIVSPIKSFEVDKRIWVPLGFLVTILSSMFAVSSFLSNWLYLLGDVASPIMIFILPQILYLFSVPTKQPLPVFISICFILFGLFYILYVIRQYV